MSKLMRDCIEQKFLPICLVEAGGEVHVSAIVKSTASSASKATIHLKSDITKLTGVEKLFSELNKFIQFFLNFIHLAIPSLKDNIIQL